uniref:VAN3-binding protein-like n=1 Tax=Erigeron canadensis TaxID=72917 RepID=UPI001CB9C299|nr:VAN3-binding protein-like [Erigeron canadensis]
MKQGVKRLLLGQPWLVGFKLELNIGNTAGGATSAATATGGGGKTVGRLLKDIKEKKKEEARVHNAQSHATVSVAGVDVVVAAIGAATAASAVASVVTLVAAQCVEAVEAMGVERDHLASVVSSAVNVKVEAKASTHLLTSMLAHFVVMSPRGAATLKARTVKETRNIPSVPRAEKGSLYSNGTGSNSIGSFSDEFLLLKRTCKGDLHWKIVSFYINNGSGESFKCF